MFPPRVIDWSGRYRPGTMDAGGGNPCNQLVYHFTVSGSRYPVARNLAEQVINGTAGGGTQAYVDDTEVVLPMPARRKAYASGSNLGHNNTAYHIEICGGIQFGSRGNPSGPDDDWLNPDDPAGQAFINAAWWGAQKCHEFEINPRLLSIQETKDPNAPGITTHYRISIADGPGGSDHIDWDDTEPVAQLIALTKFFYDNPGATAPGQEDEVTPEDRKAIAAEVWNTVIPGTQFTAATILTWANKKAWEIDAQIDELNLPGFRATVAELLKADPSIPVDGVTADAIAEKVVAAFGRKLAEAAATKPEGQP